MGRIGKRYVAIVGLLAVVAGCSSSKKTTSSGNQAGGAALGEAGADSGQAATCEPGALRCDGLNVKLCDASGSSESIAHTCLPTESCVNGGCAAGACAPSSSFCEGSAVRQCDAKGQSSTVVQVCAPALFCNEDEGKAHCSEQACTPGAAICQGSVATTCRSDGSGPKPGGTDCNDSKQACYAGRCRDVACTPGTRLCQHDDVYLCGQNGTDLSLWADCQAMEVCDGDLGSCRSKLCEPGKSQCDGTRAVTCNEFGSGWLPDSKDCSASAEICVAGSCKKQVCSPYASFCQDGDVWQCDSTGVSTSRYDVCQSFEHCEAYSASAAYCNYNECTPGQKVCSGNLVVTCTDSGEFPPEGMSCSDTQYCENAQCKDLGCTPGNYYCKDSDVYYCQFGAPPYVVQTCVDETVCQERGGGQAGCAPLACSPGAKGCINDQIGTCGDDGQSVKSVTDDCSAAKKVCTSELECAASAADTLGVAESISVVYTGTLIADAIEVSSPRKLTEIQAQLVLAAPRDLRWVLYELSGSNYVAKVDKLVSAVTGNGFISSGSFNYSLKAGKRYLIGVAVSGGDTVAYQDSAPFPRSVSFGSIVGGVYAGYYSSLADANVYPDYVFQMKLATEAP